MGGCLTALHAAESYRYGLSLTSPNICPELSSFIGQLATDDLEMTRINFENTLATTLVSLPDAERQDLFTK